MCIANHPAKRKTQYLLADESRLGVPSRSGGGPGHVVATVIRSIRGSDLQAAFEFDSLLFDTSYGDRI